MGRAPCCDKANVKKGPWSPEEDAKLKEYIEKNGTGGNWIALPHKVGLRRCGKSCRLRWLNYLRPNLKHGEFSDEEDRIICSLFATIGSRWSIIATQLPGRTDNDIKNYWNTKLKKKLMAMTPSTQYQKRPHIQASNLYPLPSNTSFLQTSVSMASPYSPLHSYESVKPFSRAYDPISPNFTTVISSNSSGLDGFMNPVHGNYNQVNKDGKNNLLMLGGEASCSSSDGSCITNQISHGDQDLCFQGYFGKGVDENQKFLFSTTEGYSSSSSLAGNYGCFSENPQDYYSAIEEIKELISTNNSNMCSNNLNFFVDDIKTEEKVLLDY